MRNGIISRRQPLAPLTGGTASGSLPTPQHRDWKDSGPTQGNRKSPNLGTVAARDWPTPTARLGTARGPQAKRYHDPARSNDLDDAVAASGTPGSLNPTFVEWLMGFPLGFTEVETLTPAASRKRAQRAHPTMTCCERCGSTWRLQRHHTDLQRAESVEILCQTCHVAADFEAGTRKRRAPKTCVVCESVFTEYSHSRVKTCSPACLSELGRQNARKRWGGGTASPTSDESRTASPNESTDCGR